MEYITGAKSTHDHGMHGCTTIEYNGQEARIYFRQTLVHVGHLTVAHLYYEASSYHACPRVPWWWTPPMDKHTNQQLLLINHCKWSHVRIYTYTRTVGRGRHNWNVNTANGFRSSSRFMSSRHTASSISLHLERSQNAVKTNPNSQDLTTKFGHSYKPKGNI